jgi:membrane fusion protein, multidrug efflux system
MAKRTKRILIWSLLVVAIAALALPKLVGTSSGGASGKEASARAGGSGGGRGGGGGKGGGGPVSVRAVVVSSGELDDRLRVSGTILPSEQVDLQSETAGKITGIFFREGERVGAGKLLVRINDAELQAQLKRAQYRRTLAAAKEARQRQLLERKAISPADYDIAINELNTADAEISLVKAQIAKTEIRAPFAGVIGLRSVSLGSYIAPTTKIATLSSVDQVKVDFFIPERYSGTVRPGSNVKFSVEGSDESIAGRVYAIEPRLDQSTRTLQVRATAPNRGGLLVPGAFAEVEILLNRTEQAITVPSESVIPESGGKMSVLVTRNGKVESTPVEVGLRTSRKVQVLSGLTPGDTVISSGIQMVKPGGMVKITGIDEMGDEM